MSTYSFFVCFVVLYSVGLCVLVRLIFQHLSRIESRLEREYNLIQQQRHDIHDLITAHEDRLERLTAKRTKNAKTTT